MSVIVIQYGAMKSTALTLIKQDESLAGLPTAEILARLESACQMVPEIDDADLAKKLRDQAQAMSHYLRQQNHSVELQHKAGELKCTAEIRLGELFDKNVTAGNPKLTQSSHDARIGKLPEGVSWSDSSRWQLIATSIPPEKRKEYFTEAKKTSDGPTTAGLVRLAKILRKQDKIETIELASDTCTIKDLHALVAAGRTFGTIYIDPPWAYGNQGTRSATGNHYPTMTVEQMIEQLPVRHLAAEQSHLHLWTTNGFLFDCPKLFDAWGFEFKSLLVWDKEKLGIGNYWRLQTEYLLLGVRGGLTFSNHSQPNIVRSARTRHSAKPESIRRMIEKVSPGPRLELFGRRVADGWTVWGNQIEKTMFDSQIEEVA